MPPYNNVIFYDFLNNLSAVVNYTDLNVLTYINSTILSSPEDKAFQANERVAVLNMLVSERVKTPIPQCEIPSSIIF